MSLLNAILQPATRDAIANLELLKPFNEKTSEDAKLSIVDLKARDESGRQFLIEMQMLAADVFRQSPAAGSVTGAPEQFVNVASFP